MPPSVKTSKSQDPSGSTIETTPAPKLSYHQMAKDIQDKVAELNALAREFKQHGGHVAYKTTTAGLGSHVQIEITHIQVSLLKQPPKEPSV